MTTVYSIVLHTEPGDLYAAGRDGNEFESDDEARAAIPGLAKATSTRPEEWTVIERRAPAVGDPDGAQGLAS